MTTTHSTTPSGTQMSWLDKQAEKFENARFFWMAVYLTVQSCLGSVACGFILMNDASIIMLSSCAAITMGCNAVLIAQGPGKWCVLSFYASILVNTIFIIVNVLSL